MVNKSNHLLSPFNNPRQLGGGFTFRGSTIKRLWPEIVYRPILVDEDVYEDVKAKEFLVSLNSSQASWLARRIMDCPPGSQVDHINGDVFDNRRENLQILSPSENQKKRKPFKRRVK